MLAQCEADELNQQQLQQQQQQQQPPTLQPVVPTAGGNGAGTESLLSRRSQVSLVRGVLKLRRYSLVRLGHSAWMTSRCWFTSILARSLYCYVRNLAFLWLFKITKPNACRLHLNHCHVMSHVRLHMPFVLFCTIFRKKLIIIKTYIAVHTPLHVSGWNIPVSVVIRRCAVLIFQRPPSRWLSSPTLTASRTSLLGRRSAAAVPTVAAAANVPRSIHTSVMSRMRLD